MKRLQSTNYMGYTLAEELANSITHGIGVLLSVAALTLLVVLAALHGDVWHVVSFSIYGISLVLLYLASTLYHSVQRPQLKRRFRVFDHAAIYVLIAGTYTPFLLVNMRGPWGWTGFGVVWGLALVGIIYKTLFINRYERVATAAYVLMGWMSVILVKEAFATISLVGLIWVAAGGLFYTVGVLFLVWKKIPFNHAIWHLFVLGGSVCHFFAVLFHVLPVKSQ